MKSEYLVAICGWSEKDGQQIAALLFEEISGIMPNTVLTDKNSPELTAQTAGKVVVWHNCTGFTEQAGAELQKFENRVFFVFPDDGSSHGFSGFEEFRAPEKTEYLLKKADPNQVRTIAAKISAQIEESEKNLSESRRSAYTEEERKQIENRLKNLGYL